MEEVREISRQLNAALVESFRQAEASSAHVMTPLRIMHYEAERKARQSQLLQPIDW